MYPLIDLNGKRIVVVGASRGIGKQVAITLSEVGATCLLVSRNESSLVSVLNELDGDGHDYYTMDASDIDHIETDVKEIVFRFGRIDGLVYVAGVSDDRPLGLLKPDVVDSIMKINYMGFIELVRCICKRKRYNPGMHIVGVASTAAFSGTVAHTIYSSSKAAIISAVRCLARELADKEICINAVAPSMINTDMYSNWLDNNEEGGYQYLKMKRMQYLGVGDTEDVANVIAFLLSPASQFITGSCMVVDGGASTN